jgi:hypothetical protein
VAGIFSLPSPLLDHRSPCSSSSGVVTGFLGRRRRQLRVRIILLGVLGLRLLLAGIDGLGLLVVGASRHAELLDAVLEHHDALLGLLLLASGSPFTIRRLASSLRWSQQSILDVNRHPGVHDGRVFGELAQLHIATDAQHDVTGTDAQLLLGKGKSFNVELCC